MKMKYQKSNKYKGVARHNVFGRDYWVARCVINGMRWEKNCETEREAAKQYDLKRIEHGKQPINIYKQA